MLTGRTTNLSDPLHAPRQHSHTVQQQTAVGRIMNVGFRDGGVDAHLAALDGLLFAGDANDSRLYLLKYLWSQSTFDPRQRLGVGNFLSADPSEDSIDQIRTDFTLQRVEAPVTHVL